ncbi:MAG: hypothetical protein ACYDCK_00475 [Thermoplasmatota archaeon]
MKTRGALLFIALTLVVSSAALAGCFGRGNPISKTDVNAGAKGLISGKQQNATFDLASDKPKTYSVPGQLALPMVHAFFNGSVDPTVDASYEGNADQGGMDYNAVIQTVDVAKFVPAGEPTQMIIKLWWDAKEANSADLDIYVDVPGTKTSYSDTTYDFNWLLPIKSLTVNTMGVAGQKALIGVEATSGHTYTAITWHMDVTFSYAKDALAAGIPFAFDVPAAASGLIVDSVKVGGSEHIKSQFAIIGPDDELVQFVNFNDIEIPTQSVFIPVAKPGQYIFYAFNMTGGFLGLRADAPLDQYNVSALKTQMTAIVDSSGPAPGVIERDWGYDSAIGSGMAATPMSNQVTATFQVTKTFPLGIWGFVTGSPDAAPMAQIKITSPKGVVNEKTVILHYGDDHGTLGLTNDRGYDNTIDYSKLAKGAYKVEIVNDSPDAVGHMILTYVR